MTPQSTAVYSVESVDIVGLTYVHCTVGSTSYPNTYEYKHYININESRRAQ